MTKTRIKFLFTVAGLMLAGLVLVACGTAIPTAASCSFVYGTSGDAQLRKVLYPGQSYTLNTHEAKQYVPCNSRNFIINDGSKTNANGSKVGDSHTPLRAYTKTGIGIDIQVRADWTLNQSRAAMEKFFTVCFKYNCASEKDIGGSVNSSTPGWNSMLAENMEPAMAEAARIVAFQLDDDIWQKHDPNLYTRLEDEMSPAFTIAARRKLGFSVDLFCGSGNSQWKDPTKPGEGEFQCSPVRISVERVERAPLPPGDNSAGALTINTQRRAQAEALYGPELAGYVLADQDRIERCKAAGTTCIVNIGGQGGGPAIVPQVRPQNPGPSPAATPAATAAATATPRR